jgi:hypothetical protein
MSFEFLMDDEDFEEEEEDSDDLAEDKKDSKKEVKDEELNIAGAFRAGASPISVSCPYCGRSGTAWVLEDSKECACPNCKHNLRII